MTSSNDKEEAYKFSFDGITLGETYRQYRKLLLDEAAGTTDESGSSLADHLLDIDMGGGGVRFAHVPRQFVGQVSQALRWLLRHAQQRSRTCFFSQGEGRA